jgi:hypothetical protein
VSFADRLAAEVAARQVTKCSTCKVLRELNDEDHAEYVAAKGAHTAAVLARVLGIQAGAYRLHVSQGHDESR